MDATNFASRTIFAKGWINSILGAIHIAGAFTFEKAHYASVGTPDMRRDYLVWFWGVGVFILFSGILDLICVRGLRDRSNLAWRIALFSALSIGLFGTFGVIIYGIAPPLVLSITGAAATLVLVGTRKVF